MQYIEGLQAYNGTEKTAVTLGKFDGLHRGHQKLIDKVKDLALSEGLKSMVCSFDMQPFFASISKTREILMTKEEKKFRLADQVDYLVDCPFTREFSQMSAEAFIQEILVKVFHAKYVVVGTDFCFGHEKKGDIHMLKAYEKACGYQLFVIEKEKYQNRVISSTYVKEALRNGELTLANQLLGYAYMTKGVVSHGKKLGRRLGFPTINVVPGKGKLMPPSGVYAVRVRIDGCWYGGIGNVGVKPTVTDAGEVVIESYLFDYNGDAYEKDVVVELLEFRRPEQKFASVEELKKSVDLDIEYGKQYFHLY